MMENGRNLLKFDSLGTSIRLECQNHLKKWFIFPLLIKIDQSTGLTVIQRNCIRTKEANENPFYSMGNIVGVCAYGFYLLLSAKIESIASNYRKIDFNCSILCPVDTSILFVGNFKISS